MAEREVEAAKSLCVKWKAEEEAAVSENARLQVLQSDPLVDRLP